MGLLAMVEALIAELVAEGFEKFFEGPHTTVLDYLLGNFPDLN